MKKPLVVIAGPTAVGKTEISLLVARRLGGEIISADSMQVYKGMDIGTAKPTTAEMGRVKHYMLDIIEPHQEFSVADFQRLARGYIEDIHNRLGLPIVVGGTGLYINSLVYNLDFAHTVSDPKLREYFGRLAVERGKEYLSDLLKRVDPETAQKLHANDTRRTIRALEVYYCSGKPISAQRNDTVHNQAPYDMAIFGLRLERDELYRKIELRVDKMIADGLVDEVKELLKNGCTRQMVSMQGLGYKEIIGHLEGEYSLDEAVELLKRNTRRFAKRQFTWFRRDDRIFWIDVHNFGNKNEIANTIIEHIKFKLKV